MAPACRLSSSIRGFVEGWGIYSKLQQSDSTKLVDSLGPDYMDPEVWKNLPEELLEHVRSKLPFTSLLRFCAVCKNWRSAIMCANSPAPRHSRKCLLIQTCNYPLTAFNSRKWEALPDLPGPPASLRVVASAGGLLCMRSRVPRELVVWNPVTRRVRHLMIPQIELGVHDKIIVRMSLLNVNESYYRIGLVYNTSENCYRVIVAIVSKGVPGVTLVYNSGTGRWKRTEAVPPGFSFFLNALSSETAFYCAMHCDHQILLRYDFLEESWSATRMPVTSSTPKSLISIRGEVMLLTEVYEVHPNVDKLFVFQLTGSSDMIEEFIPQNFVKKVFKDASSAREGWNAEFHCLVQGDTVYFVGMSMRAEHRWLRIQRSSIFMRVWVHDIHGEDLDSHWSCIGFKDDNIDWADSSRMMRSDYSRLSVFLIVPSLTSEP